MTKSIIKITFISLLSIFSLYAATETLDAASGTGTGNEWSAGGASVGADCAAQGGTEANTNNKSRELSAPLANSSESGVIVSVQVRVYARSSVNLAGTADGIRVSVFNAGTMYQDATTDEVGTALAYYTNTWITSPMTNQTWTWAEVDGIDVGCQSNAGGASSIDLLYVDHVEVIVTYDNRPVVSGLETAVNLDNDSDQKTDGSGQVIVDYEVSDADNATVTISLEYWNNSTWASATTTSGDIGAGIDATSSTTDRSITWEADTDLGTVEVSNYNVRVIATDGTGADTISRSANDLIIDTQDPTGYGCSTPADLSGPSGPDVTLTSTVASDLSTVSYYIEYDDNADCSSPLGNSGWQSGDNDWVATSLSLGSTYYWRVNAKDSYGNEGTASSIFQFTVDNSKPNVVLDNASQTSTDGSGEVTVQYDLSDPQTQTCKIKIEYSMDGSTWYNAHIKSVSTGTINNPGEINSISTNQTDATFVWDTQNAGNGNGAFTGEDASVYVRLTPTDSDLNDGDVKTSLAFTVDNQDPTGYGCSSPADDAINVSTDPTLTSSAASDLSTIQYYFEIDDADPFSSAIENSGWQAGATWQPTTLLINTTYSWRVNARDSYGNTATASADFAFSTLSYLWVYPTSGAIDGACTAPALGDGVVYIGTQGNDDKVYCLDIDDGTLNWSYGASEDVYNVCSFYHSGSGKEAVYFTCSDATLNAIWDNGLSPATVKFTAVDLGAKTPTSEPIIDVDGSNIYLGYYKDGYKRSSSDGSPVWATGTINPSGSSSPVVDNANVYFAAAGDTYKYTIDNTAQGSVAHGADTPLGVWGSLLYVANSSDNYVYAVNASVMTDNWTSADLSGTTNTGFFRAFPSGQSSTYNYGYIAAGSAIKKVSCSDGSVLATYAAGNTVNSMPIVTPDVTKVFFGCDDSKAYCVKADLSATFSAAWPKTVGGPIQNSPAVDLTNDIVVFTTNEGKIYGFTIP